MAALPVPEGFHGVTPMVAVRNAAKAIDFYKAAFGATEVFRLVSPDGTVAHAELRIGNGIFMLAEEQTPYNQSPHTLNGTSVILTFYVDDVDAIFAQAVAAGATVMLPVAQQFYGDRTGRLADPFGHQWGISTHTENVSHAEMQRRFDDVIKSHGKHPD